MNTTPFFNRPTYFLSSSQYDQMKASKLSESLNTLAKESSKLFHYSWRDDLVSAKGEEYQHFRPLKDDAIASKLRELHDSGNFTLAAAGRILNPDCDKELVSPDGKDLFQFDEDGTVKFDLIRVDFEHLTPKWQAANFDASMFALCLVQTVVNQEGHIDFEVFEKMSSDIHEFWVSNNNYKGQSAKLMTIYKNLPVDSLRNNQKDKDRVHINMTVDSLSTPVTEASKNRKIVMDAMKMLFGEQQKEGTLDSSFSAQIDALQSEIEQQNIEDYTKYKQLSVQTKEQAMEILNGKEKIDMNTFEELSAAFHGQWVDIYGANQDENIVADYSELPVNDPDFNQKQFSRECVQTFLKEMADDGLVSQSMIADVNGLSQEIEEKNKMDYLEYEQTQSLVEEQ